MWGKGVYHPVVGGSEGMPPNNFEKTTHFGDIQGGYRQKNLDMDLNARFLLYQFI